MSIVLLIENLSLHCSDWALILISTYQHNYKRKINFKKVFQVITFHLLWDHTLMIVLTRYSQSNRFMTMQSQPWANLTVAFLAIILPKIITINHNKQTHVAYYVEISWVIMVCIVWVPFTSVQYDVTGKWSNTPIYREQLRNVHN